MGLNHPPMQLRLVLATSLGLSSCGADPAFDQCEAQRSAYTCGTTKGLVIDCAAFRGKTCDAMVMETWLRCQLAAHVNACGVDSATGATGIEARFPDDAGRRPTGRVLKAAPHDCAASVPK